MARKAAEQVLCYHFDAETLDAVRIVMKKFSIACRALPEESWREKVGFLLGRRGFTPATQGDDSAFDFPDAVMVLDHIQGKRLDQVLAAMKSAGIPPIRYKATVTPYNVLWTLRRLCETMKKEHAYMMTEGAKKDDSKA